MNNVKCLFLFTLILVLSLVKNKISELRRGVILRVVYVYVYVYVYLYDYVYVFVYVYVCLSLVKKKSDLFQSIFHFQIFNYFIQGFLLFVTQCFFLVSNETYVIHWLSCPNYACLIYLFFSYFDNTFIYTMRLERSGVSDLHGGTSGCAGAMLPQRTRLL